MDQNYIMLVDPLKCVAYKDKVSTYISSISQREFLKLPKQLIYEVDRRLEKESVFRLVDHDAQLLKAIVDQGLTEKIYYLFDGPRVGIRVIGSRYAYLGNNINEVPKYLKGNAQWFYDRYEIDGSNVLR